MLSTHVFSFAGSLIICMALIPPLMAVANRLHVLDIPTDSRRLHFNAVPKIGGLAFGIATFAAMLLWAPKSDIVVGGLLGGVTILLFGLWDDRANLSYRIKFCGQALAAMLFMSYGNIHIDVSSFSDSGIHLWLAYPLTLFVIVGVTNAVNLADGLDGLAGGLALLSCAAMAWLAYLGDNHTVILLMVPLLGALLGFLRFNTYPARIFMGDAGSQLLGFFMAISAIVLTDPERGPYTPVLGLFLLGLPLLDTAGVMVQRLREGRSPFAADRNHFHHKLLDMGFTYHGAVLMIYLSHASIVGLGYVLRWQTDVMTMSVYSLVAVTVLVPFLQARRQSIAEGPIVKRAGAAFRRVGHVTSYRWLAQEPIRILGIAVPTFLIMSVFLFERIPHDIGYVATAFFVIILLSLRFVPQSAPFVVRGGLYSGSTFVMYLIGRSSDSFAVANPLNAYFLILALLVALTIRFGSEHRFQTTPLDYLMVFLAMIIAVLPELYVVDVPLGFLAARLIVLFFSFEVLLDAFPRRLMQLGLVALWLLFGVAIRTWQ